MYQRYVAYYLDLAERAESELRGPRQVAWLALLKREGDNLRAALGWAAARGEVELGLRLAAALWRFWTAHGGVGEGRRWLDELLAQDAQGQQCEDATGGRRWVEGRGDATGREVVWAKALVVAGTLAGYQGDVGRAIELLDAGAALARGTSDAGYLSLALSALGDLARSRGDLARATPLLEESATLARGAGDAWVLGVALDALGVVAYYGADHGRAAALWQESLDLRRRLGDKRGIALSLASLGELAHARGELAHARGDLARAVALLRENVAVARELGDKMDLAWSLHNLGAVALEQGDDVRAAALYEESLTLHLDVTGRKGNSGVALCLDGLAGVACARGRHDRAAQLLAAADALRAALAMPLEPLEGAAHDRVATAPRVGIAPRRPARTYRSRACRSGLLRHVEPPTDIEHSVGGRRRSSARFLRPPS